MPETVAACLIVMNESERIGDALDSVRFCDEVIVVDGGSTDDTPSMAESLGARVVHNAWPGYAKQRNVAIEQASTDWILEIDADERVSAELRREIEAFLASPPKSVDMAVMPLRDTFLGKVLGPSSKYPMYRGRLFRRESYRHDERRTVHEGLWPAGQVWSLEGDLDHVLASSWREVLDDCVSYARLQAAHRPRPGPVAIANGVVVRPVLKLAYRLVIVGGWRDGGRGLARIAAECASDALSWIYAVRQPERTVYDVHAAAATGPLRIVGLAASERGAGQGAEWLARASRLGADAVLVTSSRVESDGVHVRQLERFGPVKVARELEAQAQIRPIDAILGFDAASALTARLLRPRLRSLHEPFDPQASPEEVLGAIGQRRRPSPGVSEVVAR